MSKDKKRNLIVGSIVAFVILLLALSGYVLYAFVYIPSQIAASHNKNIDIYNSNIAKTEDILKRASQNLKSDPSSEVLSRQNGLIKELEEQTDKVKKDSLQLDQGINQDTKNFSGTVQNALSTEAKTLESASTALKNVTCLLDKTLIVQNKFSEAQTALGNVTEKSSNEELVQAAKAAAGSVDSALEPFGQIETCLAGDLSVYRTEQLQSDILTDIALFRKFSEALKSLGAGVEANNLQVVEKASQEIREVADSTLKTFENTSLAGAINFTVSEFDKLNKESQTQNANVQKASTELKTKFQLADQ